MKKIGLFPVNNVIINMISLFWLVLSSAGAFVGAQEEEQPQIKASYPVMQAALKMPESTVYVRSLDEALRKSENIVLCQLYCVRIEKPHNTEGQVTCFLKVLTPLRGNRLAVGSRGKYYSYWGDMLFVPEVKEDPQEDYDCAFHCNIKCFLMCSDEEAGVSESGEFSIFRESPLIHLIYGKEVEEYIMDFLHTEIESVKTASTISHSTCITKYEDIRQLQVEEVSVSKDTIEYAANAVKSICSKEPREYCRYKYIYYIGFIPKKSIKPTEVYYSQKEQKLISTDELPDILVFIAHMYDEKTRYNHTGGSCHFYCDATTGEIIGYLHAM